MRKLSLVLNLIVVGFFSCFLAYTFFAQAHLNSLARAFVTQETLKYSKPIVDAAEATLESPVVKRLLSEDRAAAIRDEIADYRNDPISFIEDITNQRVREESPREKNPLLDKVAFIKTKIRDFYDDTLNALILDLRIFSVSNLVAGLLAFGLAYRSKTGIRRPVVWFSCLMFVSVLYCSFMYIDDLSFFRILFRSHLGWWYPVVLFITTVRLYRNYGDLVSAKKSDSDK